MERLIRNARYFLVALLSLALLGACSPSVEEPLRVGANIWPGYASLHLAQHLNFFPAGSIHLAELPSATAVLHELQAGNLDAACLTLDEALSARADGLDLQVLLVMDISAGGDALLARPVFTSLSQLRGKTVAVENTAAGAILLAGALESAGLQSGDVKLMYASVDQHEEAYSAGSADAVVTFEPVRSRLMAEGAVPLFDSRQIPGRIVDVLVAPRSITESRATQLRALVAGHFAALDYRRDYPADANRRQAPHLGIAPDQVVAMFEGMEFPDRAENYRLLGGEQPILEETVQRLIAIMRINGMLTEKILETGMMQPGFLPPGVP